MIDEWLVMSYELRSKFLHATRKIAAKKEPGFWFYGGVGV